MAVVHDPSPSPVHFGISTTIFRSTLPAPKSKRVPVRRFGSVPSVNAPLPDSPPAYWMSVIVPLVSPPPVTLMTLEPERESPPVRLISAAVGLPKAPRLKFNVPPLAPPIDIVEAFKLLLAELWLRVSAAPGETLIAPPPC